MNENSLDRSPTENLLDLNLDKDTWIYTYGSATLQQVRSFGYECEVQYLKERLKIEYPGFKINSNSSAKKLDFPPLYAIRESLKWERAYIAKQYLHGEVVALDNYLGKYQIIKKTEKPWYLVAKNLGNNEMTLYSILFGVFIGLIFCAAL
ncbi:hypothetical protein [Chamaesiphon sp. OTE_8_metabat_110]|uniref:hypothetical protein n=1 Tax=Chamaesiphon sp. OTE_8_metabat_110 TaxID=2964696 RepID=UPI00286B3B12|nr:hypothetical protein [Chamaesiphon sp. OTE_8_metabat_110]